MKTESMLHGYAKALKAARKEAIFPGRSRRELAGAAALALVELDDIAGRIRPTSRDHLKMLGLQADWRAFLDELRAGASLAIDD